MTVNKKKQPEKQDSEFAKQIYNTANDIIHPFLRDFEKKIKSENPEAHILKYQFESEEGALCYIFTRSDTKEPICAIRYNKEYQPTLYL